MPLPNAGEEIEASDWTDVFPQGVDGWASYTPTWTSTGTQPALGNGTISGAWTKIGRTVHYVISMTTGATSTYGTGVYLWSLPTPAAGGSRPGSNCYIVDSSVGTQFPRAVRQNSSTVVFALSEAGVFVGPTAPMTWAAGDSIVIAGTYEAAS